MSGISVDGQIDEGDGGIVGSTIPRDAPLDGSGSGREEQALSSAGGAQTADGVVRPDFYLCDVGSTNGTYVQVRCDPLFLLDIVGFRMLRNVCTEICIFIRHWEERRGWIG